MIFIICIQQESKLSHEKVRKCAKRYPPPPAYVGDSRSRIVKETTELPVLITTTLYCFSWGMAATGATFTDI